VDSFNAKFLTEGIEAGGAYMHIQPFDVISFALDVPDASFLAIEYGSSFLELTHDFIIRFFYSIR